MKICLLLECCLIELEGILGLGDLREILDEK